MTLIEAKELRKIFGSIRALDGVTVEISEGITLILGPNGGGKSTFLKLATGLFYRLQQAKHLNIFRT